MSAVCQGSFSVSRISRSSSALRCRSIFALPRQLLQQLGVLQSFRSVAWGIAAAICLTLLEHHSLSAADSKDNLTATSAAFRGPVDIAVGPDEAWAVTANELSGTASLVNLASRAVVHEIDCGGHPVAVARLDAAHVAISCSDSGEVILAKVNNSSPDAARLEIVQRIAVGYLPHGLAVGKAASDAELPRVYVGLMATGEVAEVDLTQGKVVKRFAVGHWPRYLTASRDGRRLAVGLSGENAIAVVDLANYEVLYREPLSGGINIGHMQTSDDGVHVYFPWMIYRSNPINPRNIRRGWILASRAARVRLDGPADREAISLDVPGIAVADPHGIALTPNEHRMVISSSGTHELLVYRLQNLPFVGAGGPGDLIDEKLLRDRDLFYRIPVGGRPMAVRALADNRRVLVANHTMDELQWVDVESKQLVDAMSLGPQQRILRSSNLFIAAWRFFMMASGVWISGTAVRRVTWMAAATRARWIRGMMERR